MMNKNVVKILCIILAILMFGSVMVAAITSFALEPQELICINSPIVLSNIQTISYIMFDNVHILV